MRDNYTAVAELPSKLSPCVGHGALSTPPRAPHHPTFPKLRDDIHLVSVARHYTSSCSWTPCPPAAPANQCRATSLASVQRRFTVSTGPCETLESGVADDMRHQTRSWRSWRCWPWRWWPWRVHIPRQRAPQPAGARARASPTIARRQFSSDNLSTRNVVCNGIG